MSDVAWLCGHTLLRWVWLQFVCWCWQIGYKDLAAGKRATRRNEVWGVLVFHANYSLMIRERITFIPIMKLTFPETVNNSYIDAYLDMSSEFLEMKRDMSQFCHVFTQWNNFYFVTPKWYYLRANYFFRIAHSVTGNFWPKSHLIALSSVIEFIIDSILIATPSEGNSE